MDEEKIVEDDKFHIKKLEYHRKIMFLINKFFPDQDKIMHFWYTKEEIHELKENLYKLRDLNKKIGLTSVNDYIEEVLDLVKKIDGSNESWKRKFYANLRLIISNGEFNAEEYVNENFPVLITLNASKFIEIPLEKVLYFSSDNEGLFVSKDNGNDFLHFDSKSKKIIFSKDTTKFYSYYFSYNGFFFYITFNHDQVKNKFNKVKLIRNSSTRTKLSICPKCGLKLDKPAKFCGRCGKSLINFTSTTKFLNLDNVKTELQIRFVNFIQNKNIDMSVEDAKSQFLEVCLIKSKKKLKEILKSPFFPFSDVQIEKNYFSFLEYAIRIILLNYKEIIEKNNLNFKLLLTTELKGGTLGCYITGDGENIDIMLNLEYLFYQFFINDKKPIFYTLKHEIGHFIDNNYLSNRFNSNLVLNAFKNKDSKGVENKKKSESNLIYLLSKIRSEGMAVLIQNSTKEYGVPIETKNIKNFNDSLKDFIMSFIDNKITDQNNIELQSQYKDSIFLFCFLYLFYIKKNSISANSKLIILKKNVFFGYKIVKYENLDKIKEVIENNDYFAITRIDKEILMPFLEYIKNLDMYGMIENLEEFYNLEHFDATYRALRKPFIDSLLMKIKTCDLKKKCEKCGFSAKSDAKFCGNCGTKLEKPKFYCRKCHNLIDITKSFCGNCGHRIHYSEFFCINCDHEISFTAKFCGNCGQKLNLNNN